MFTLYLEKTYFEHAKFSSTREPNTCEKYYVQMFDRLSVMSHRLTYTYTFHMCMCVCVCECVFDCMRLTAERWRSSCSGHQYSTNNGRITKNIPFECRIKLLFDSSALCLATQPSAVCNIWPSQGIRKYACACMSKLVVSLYSCVCSLLIQTLGIEPSSQSRTKE